MRTRYKKTAFTIIELLTVMSIIIILISLLLPALNAVKRFSRVVLQKNQFRNIGAGLQVYESDFDEHPDSSALDADGKAYCGAMKLGEVMAGQDGLGFHLDSRLTIDGKGADGTDLYPAGLSSPYDATETENLRSRKEYLERKYIQLCSLVDLYETPGTTFSEPNDVALLCDVFRSVRSQTTGRKMGMPVLYYRADTSRMSHDIANPANADNIYNYLDNQDFLAIGWDSDTKEPPLYEGISGVAGQVFYENTLNKVLEEESNILRPYNKDSYILISAGWDGIYGTKDDVYNFKD